jgi:hypothetical protein
VCAGALAASASGILLGETAALLHTGHDTPQRRYAEGIAYRPRQVQDRGTGRHDAQVLWDERTEVRVWATHEAPRAEALIITHI